MRCLLLPVIFTRQRMMILRTRRCYEKKLTMAKTEHDKTTLKRQIDRLVYELYGLTDEEIEIVEGNG